MGEIYRRAEMVAIWVGWGSSENVGKLVEQGAQGY